MTLTKHVQRIVAREIRPYILPLLFSNYDNPAMTAEHVSDEDWLRWLKHWACSQIPIRTVRNGISLVTLNSCLFAKPLFKVTNCPARVR